MTRQTLLPSLGLALIVAACPPAGQATLDLSVGSPRVDADISLGVTATAADGTPGQGAVALSTSLGTLAASTLTLADGSGRTTLKCARSTPGCVAGATIDLTARWTIPGGVVVTATRQVRLTDSAATDAGQADAGASDGGEDAGWPDDAGEPSVDAGTPLNLGPGGGVVLGQFGNPFTVGFSPLSSNTTVLLGFDGLPEQSLIYADRLLYVRRGVAFVWEEDFADGGPPRDAGLGGPPDAGAPDAGPTDAGRADAGSPDAGGGADAGSGDGGLPDGGRDGGFDAGPPFIRYPEVNDPVFATCADAFPEGDAGFVRALVPRPDGRLWTACSATATSDITLFLSGADLISSSVSVVPLAAQHDTLLGRAADGGLFLISRGPEVAIAAEGRRFSSSARPVAGGFELLALEPNSACVVAHIAAATGALTTRALPATVPGGLACLEGVVSKRNDAVYFVTGDVGSTGISAWPLSGRSTADGGVVFVAGPPSDLRADPPVLSIDFGPGVTIVVP